jgi:hypothetical protein
MSKGRFLNQKLGKRATRRIALLKSSLATARQPVKTRIRDSGFRAPNNAESNELKQTRDLRGALGDRERITGGIGDAGRMA